MSPPPDAHNWFEVPHTEEPIRYEDLPAPEDPALTAQEHYQTHWIPEVRMPQLIEDLEFVQDIHCESDADGAIQDYDFRSRWEAMKLDYEPHFKGLYTAVRTSPHPSLANARAFQLQIPERRAHGHSARSLLLWLDSDHPLEDSVFFNTGYEDEGHSCLVIRRVTHVRFLRDNGTRDTERFPQDANGVPAVSGNNYDRAALNYPSYVVQWGDTLDFLNTNSNPNKFHTIFLSDVGDNFEDIDDPSRLDDPDVKFAVPGSYHDEDNRLTYVDKFTLENEQSLKPQAPKVVLGAIRMGKLWSKNFTHRYYRKGGRGYCKEKAAFVAEMGEPGPSSAGEASAPAVKRGPSRDQQRQLAMWKRGRKMPRRAD